MLSLLFKSMVPTVRTPLGGNVRNLLRWQERMGGRTRTTALSPTEAQARYLNWVLNYAAARLGTGPDAEDVCAETWAAAFAVWHKCPHPSPSDSPDDPVRAWLCGITRRKVADVLRYRSRALPTASETETAAATSPLPSPEWSVLSEEAAQMLRGAIAALPPDQAEALRLHYGDGLSLKDISNVLHRSPAAVGMLLQRARTSVRQQSASYFDSTPEGDHTK